MRTALWFSTFGFPKSGLLLPYTAQSPTLFKRIEFKTKKDINDEIERLLSEPGTKKYGFGQSMYHQMPFFCNPEEHIPDWCWDMIQDYQIITDYNVPLSKDLNDINVWTLDCFGVIGNEINNIQAYRKNHNGG